MPLFRRRRREEEAPAPWAGPLSGEEARRLLALVEADFRRRGWPFRYDGETVHSGETVYGLANLAQLCHRGPVETWPAVVVEHFDRMSDTEWEAPAELDEATRARLRVRLQHPEYVLYGAEETGAPAVRPVADGLVEALVVDFPGSISYLKAADVDAWGEARDALFAEGRARLRAATPEEPLAVEPFIGGILGVETADIYTATHALWLDELLGVEIPEAGALVALPTRHIVLARVLDSAEIVADVPHLIAAAHRMHANGPGSLATDLFWWRPDEPWLRVPTQAEEETTRIYPPDELVAVLDELGGLSPG